MSRSLPVDFQYLVSIDVFEQELFEYFFVVRCKEVPLAISSGNVHRATQLKKKDDKWNHKMK